MSLRDEAAAADDAEEAAWAKAKLLTEQKNHAATRRHLARSQERIDELEQLLERYTVADPKSMVVPKWTKPRKTRREHHATALLLLSDLHLDEVVDPAEINGLNAYDRAIAHDRLTAVVEGTIELCDRYVAGVEMDGIVVAALGDILTGDIHDELARTNEAPVMDSVTHWVPALASAVTRLADAFGAVHVPCVDGNHDRYYRKMQTKQRATSSVAWVIYNWLATVLADDPRITFSITPAPEQVIGLYDTRFLLSHGDGFRSAGGIGGIYPSLLKWLHRKHRQFEATGQPWDVALFGHWHQYIAGPDWLGNGSLKGFDQYAAANGFNPEPPRQALAIVTPERGITQQMPVYAD